MPARGPIVDLTQVQEREFFGRGTGLRRLGRRGTRALVGEPRRRILGGLPGAGPIRIPRPTGVRAQPRDRDLIDQLTRRIDQAQRVARVVEAQPRDAAGQDEVAEGLGRRRIGYRVRGYAVGEAPAAKVVGSYFQILQLNPFVGRGPLAIVVPITLARMAEDLNA